MYDRKKALADLERDMKTGAIPMATKDRVMHSIPVEVSPKEIDRIFMRRLVELRQPFWYHDGSGTRYDHRAKAGWYMTHDMRHGSDIDEFVAPYDDPRFALQCAAYELEQLLKNRAKLRDQK